MNYEKVCIYIVKNGGTVDETKFRINQCDDFVFVDKWAYPFPKPIMDELEKDENKIKMDYDIVKKEKLLEEFKQWKYYDLIMELINKK